MQTKTIRKTIEKKLEEWLETITDERLRKSVKENLLVSGGSIYSMLKNETVNDYDIYIQDIDVLKKLCEYYTKETSVEIFDGREKDKLISELESNYGGKDIVEIHNVRAFALHSLKDDQIKLFESNGKGCYKVERDENIKYQLVFITNNAISLSDDIQIVVRFWGTPEQIHSTFDFVHATNYFTFNEGVVLNKQALESIITQQLKYNGSKYPLTSIIRAKKFIKRGFNIGAGELLKIMFQISELDLTNISVLEEQLIGVDVAYFEALITAIRNKYSSDLDFKLSSSYLNALIEKIFDSQDFEN